MTALYPGDESLFRITSVLNLTLNYNYQKQGEGKEKKKLQSNKTLMINPLQPKGFLMFSGGIEKQHQVVMG